MLVLKKVWNNLEEYVCAITLIAMSILNFANVLSRYFLHYALSYSEEILMILFLWCTMFGTVVGFKRGVHLGISVLTDLLKGKLKIISILITNLVILGFTFVLLNSTILMMQSEILFDQRTTVLRIPEIYATVSILICSVLIIIRVLVDSWKCLIAKRRETIR